MPALFYVPHEDPAFDNAVSYLPADMVPKPPKRAGVAFQVSKAKMAGCSKSTTHFPSSLQLPTQTAAQPPATYARVVLGAQAEVGVAPCSAGAPRDIRNTPTGT